MSALADSASIAESDDLNKISHVSNSFNSFEPKNASFEYRIVVPDSKQQKLKAAKTSTKTSTPIFKSNKKRTAQIAVLSSPAISDNEECHLNSSFYI
jgi:hypothetical protein